MEGRYYYWDNNYINDKGENLQECFDKYGTGIQNMNKQVRYEVIFLDETKSFGNSWMLRAYSRQTGDNVPVTLYEKDKVYGKHVLNPK
jgi:hypothetical protein